ncbi:hypothetical protein [Hyalangium gracile]|uniref:hypothetical protein n=1 Tax=Hyalangium gracile TaxID=394092 RepID=UPI001CCF9DBF|nr:hypothetical protein [Hyalangium gracile]
MPKRKREELEEDAYSLETISLLFIPFDASPRKFYQKNSEIGVKGLEGFFNEKGQPVDSRRNELVPGSKFKSFQAKADFVTNLSRIVRQECELIRNIHSPDSDYESKLSSLLEGNAQQDRYRDWSERKKKRVEQVLRGYKHYPTLLFLSENPTGEPFPKRIDTGTPNLGYVKKAAIDKQQVKSVRAVNEMAVYLREDIASRLGGPSDDALFLETEVLVRDTKGLKVKAKDEYILKVRMGKQYGHSCTVAGVHLRASLVGSSKEARREEREALERFCAQHGIQLLVGDFNMDLQESIQGSRGIYFDTSQESQPRFALPRDSTVAIPFYIQQFSNSAGNEHFMGYFKADTEKLELSGVSMYGLMGASGSRHLKEEGQYYSDHPSIYLAVKSTQLTEEARNRILQRRIFKVLYPKGTHIRGRLPPPSST